MATGEVADVEVERGGAPHVAPSGGESLGADGVVNGEKGHDLAEHAVWEEAY